MNSPRRSHARSLRSLISNVPPGGRVAGGKVDGRAARAAARIDPLGPVVPPAVADGHGARSPCICALVVQRLLLGPMLGLRVARRIDDAGDVAGVGQGVFEVVA